MYRLIPVLVLVTLTGCSHVRQMQSAEKKESGAILRTNAAWRELASREADYNREIKIANELPQSLQTKVVIDSLLGLQYQLTGNAISTQAQLQKQVDALLKDDQAAHNALRSMSNSDQKLVHERDQAIVDLDKAHEQLKTKSLEAAAAWDKYDKLWNIVYALIALGIFALVLKVLAIFGVTLETVASKIP